MREAIEDIDNMQWTILDKSPLMSAQHLIIMIINNVTCYTNNDSITNFEFCYRKEVINHMQFAKDIAHKIVDYLKQKNTKIFLKINYIVTRDFQLINEKA